MVRLVVRLLVPRNPCKIGCHASKSVAILMIASHAFTSADLRVSGKSQRSSAAVLGSAA